MSDIRLSDPLRPLVGTSAAALHKHLDLRTVGDLLRHYPRRYVRLGELTTIRDLPLGEDVSLVAEVVSTATAQMKTRRGTMLHVVVTDGTDRLKMTFFNARRIARAFQVGQRMLFSGRVDEFRGEIRLNHPRWRAIGGEQDAAAAAVARPVPVYPLAGSLAGDTVAKSVGVVLDQLAEQAKAGRQIPDPLPAELRRRLGLVEIDEAFQIIHRPQEVEHAYAARRRFSFEEAFVLQVVLAQRRALDQAAAATPRPRRAGGLQEAFDRALPFVLTTGQLEVGEQIAEDLARSRPMHRLLQGEVGSGKTVVALRAMLTVADTGGQAALLAPTEVLAAQHHRSITAMLGDLAEDGLLGGPAEHVTKVVLLTGSMPVAARRAAMLDAASGAAGIVIGTHALLQEKVTFADLGLVVVDEQHRFGVEQRDVLREKGRTSPHLLVMTATPIPRTVAMTVFGDLETSTLVEVPAGRGPVSTHVVPLAEAPAWYERVWQRVAEEVGRGHQAYVVCPRIGDEAESGPAGENDGGDGDERDPVDGSDDAPALTGVLATVAELARTQAMAGLRVEMLHGRMPAEEREAVMAALTKGEVDVLVATTVIEVGVDVPNASAMVVLDADRFGVSQLHQLRGRVGRGSAGGVCLLVTRAEPGGPARTRLDAVASTTDGFALARVDLEQRREGDVLGARQSGGRSSLRILRVLRDEKMIEQARAEATAVVDADPELAGHPALAQALSDLLDEEKQAYLERG